MSSNLLNAGAAEVDVVHVNSEFSDSDLVRSSDHDPVLARFTIN